MPISVCGFARQTGTVFKPLYKETPLDWVTHETFATKDFVYFNILGFQPRLRKQASGIVRINLRTDDVELIGQVELEKDRQAIDGQLVGRGFWHCNASRDKNGLPEILLEEMYGWLMYRPGSVIGWCGYQDETGSCTSQL